MSRLSPAVKLSLLLASLLAALAVPAPAAVTETFRQTYPPPPPDHFNPPRRKTFHSSGQPAISGCRRWKSVTWIRNPQCRSIL